MLSATAVIVTEVSIAVSAATLEMAMRRPFGLAFGTKHGTKPAFKMDVQRMTKHLCGCQMAAEWSTLPFPSLENSVKNASDSV